MKPAMGCRVHVAPAAMRLLTALMLASSLAVSAALPANGQVQQVATPVSSLVLSPGDAVKITVWQKPELSGEFIVGADGRVSDPFYMDVQVAGIPFATAVERVRNYLAQYEVNPRVLVEPLFHVAVTGEVRTPNMYGLRPETTVVQAVMLAGGPTERARLSRVRLLRNGHEIPIDITAPQADAARTTIQSGDVIIIPRRVAIIRDVLGPVSSITSAVVSIAYIASRYF
jgi:polysaccharide biosynthesis/export protein